MRKFGQIQTEFWSNGSISQYPPDAKLIALYLLTSPHHNCLGCYRLPMPYVCADLNMGMDTVSKGFAILFEDGFARVDETLGWVLIPNYLKWNPVANPKMGLGLKSELALVPEKFRHYAHLVLSVKMYGRHLPVDWETVLKPYRNRIETVTIQGEGEGEEEKCFSAI